MQSPISDPHSYADDRQPRVNGLRWKVELDFDKKISRASAELRFEGPAPSDGPLDLDTRDLAITRVADLDDRPLAHELAATDPILGSRLRIQLPAQARGVRIDYATSPGASALQWLAPAQTAGKRLPFLFSQCQAIHARSVVPLQDTPRRRIRFEAEIRLPKELRALMGAAFVSRDEQGSQAVERYEMPQPIPPYLIALVAGELVSRDLGTRSRVWAEPSVVDRAAFEFAEVDSMLHAAEELFGPYDWDRFDFVVLPPSFPYGGMENPRLTFLTPTLLAGDRSLVNVLAHELAHSWAGNLVTNANAEHFWLNEGLTVYAERRIVEKVYGADFAAISAANGYRSLCEACESFRKRPELTRLRTRLAGIDPDEAFSVVPYEKGFLLFIALEHELGRARFDVLLRRYMTEFRFQSITTDDFVAFMEREAPGALGRIKAEAFFEGEGIPEGVHRPRSTRLEAIVALGRALPSAAQARAWSPAEWQVWLGQVRGHLTGDLCAEIDRKFQLTASGNYEVLVSWLEAAIEAGYAPAAERAESALGEFGRMKYLKPLYRALAHCDLARALQVFERHRAGYHPIGAQVVQSLLTPGA